jgi:hypothetical protein
MAMSTELADKVKQVRGVFTFSKPWRTWHALLIPFFGLAIPAFFAFVVREQHVPMAAWDKDIWTGVVLIPLSMAMGVLGLWMWPVRWEFTDSEIVVHKGSKVTWRLPYSDLDGAEIRDLFPGIRVLALDTKAGPRSVVFSDPRLVRSVEG